MSTEKLTQIAEYFADAKLHDMEQTIIEAAQHIKKLEKALDIYQRERDRFKHTHAEITGVYFLSGGYGEADANMLPQFVRIVPAYGCAWEQIYERTNKTISYEGS